jgi:hypothetical protein
MNPTPMSLEQIFASDDVEVVKAAFREHLLNDAWFKICEASFQMSENDLDIEDDDVIGFIRSAYNTYKLFGKTDEFIREQIADIFELHTDEERLDEIWEAI